MGHKREHPLWRRDDQCNLMGIRNTEMETMALREGPEREREGMDHMRNSHRRECPCGSLNVPPREGHLPATDDGR